jgi:hypothetical protein
MRMGSSWGETRRRKLIIAAAAAAAVIELRRIMMRCRRGKSKATHSVVSGG